MMKIDGIFQCILLPEWRVREYNNIKIVLKLGNFLGNGIDNIIHISLSEIKKIII